MLTTNDPFWTGKNVKFHLFSKENGRSQIIDLLKKDLTEILSKKLISALKAIDNEPLMFSHEQKFKPLEGEVWEIKFGQWRIACLWDPKPYKLIGFYAYIKQRQDWPKTELQNMRYQKELYLSSKVLKLNVSNKKLKN
jgi:hypothetical protein